MAFAREGKGRRLLNTLNRKTAILSEPELDKIINTYCDLGLPKEVEILLSRRGILDQKGYEFLADKVRDHASAHTWDGFSKALRKLLSSGQTMNPARPQDN